ncbi:bile acid:sodium symporter family protein [Aurantibacillus circumpalustris]|uniref:bile acid:sodium symporter family protein n=1 Tax=Aurantibacillus circumpalustris TaxID=3036359 RepID=UPI00295BC421|nr:bile acid:sodium symporter family protein [Aurantibacillus circumpalustris]
MEHFSKLKLKGLGIGWFVPSILCMVILAYYFPKPGIIKEPISLSELSSFGIFLIFFFYGAKLNFEKLRIGLNNWHLHLLIQITTFLIFPLLILSIKPFFLNEQLINIWLGLFFLSALPSTVSSSVVMVSLAGGNIPSAIFNASISAFIGILVTPLWIGLFFSNNGVRLELTSIIIKLTLQVILPVLVGMLLHKRLNTFVEKHKKSLQVFDQTIILLIIYNSFCKSFSEKLFSNMTLLEVMVLALGMLFLFVLIVLFSKFSSTVLKFNRADTITTIFCASKKSLVHGSVMAGILFAGNPIVGWIILPLMFYHAIQLIVSSFLAKRMSRIE